MLTLTYYLIIAWLVGSHSLSGWRARRTKSSRSEGPKASPKRRQLEVDFWYVIVYIVVLCRRCSDWWQRMLYYITSYKESSDTATTKMILIKFIPKASHIAARICFISVWQKQLYPPLPSEFVDWKLKAQADGSFCKQVTRAYSKRGAWLALLTTSQRATQSVLTPRRNLKAYWESDNPTEVVQVKKYDIEPVNFHILSKCFTSAVHSHPLKILMRALTNTI